MAQYFFAVDHKNKKKMDPPKGYAIRMPGVISWGHPLPGMILLANMYSQYEFHLMGDISAYDEYEYENVTEKYFAEYIALCGEDPDPDEEE